MLQKGQGTVSYGLNPRSDKNPQIGSYEIIWNEKRSDDKIFINKLFDAGKISAKEELNLFKMLSEFFASSHGMDGITIEERNLIAYAILEKL